MKPRKVLISGFLQPSEMTPQERFDALTDLFAAAWLRIRLESIRAEMDAETSAGQPHKSAICSESSLEVWGGPSPDGDAKP